MIRTLTANDFGAAHRAFVEAFSDYVVPLAPSAEQLREMLTRRGWIPELSVGVFEDERMIAFTLNGRRGGVAYDSGTGVIPSHRRRGLGRAMLEFVDPRLRDGGCTTYVLEVIEANAAAIELYTREGFVETRRLQCWTYAGGSPSPCRFAAVPLPHAGEGAWWDVQPSWQNATHSIRRARAPHVVIGDEHGYAIVFPDNGDLAQLAVKHDKRRQGRGHALLDAAANLAGKPLRLLNVDAGDAGIEAFLTSCGAAKTVSQLEMSRRLS